ncbi:MAG: FAD binding domain-containing protein [Eubacteriales bacterium]|nr:FAD binding domain-containing protein [Eubacteriales bacterium]
MYTIRHFLRPDSLEEAYQTLLHARNNTVLGGCMWLRLGKRAIGTAIDLSSLGLDQITDTGDCIEIGAMVTLRQLETSGLLQQYFGALFCDAVSGIVGTQFRNTATVGGSIYGRFGFSDVLTAFLALPTQIKTCRHGILPLEEFASLPYEKDIVECLILPKQAVTCSYQHIRFQATDFPILACAVGMQADNTYRIAVGARPARACVAYVGTAPDPDVIAESLPYADNMRASAAYRRQVCPVLIRRALEEVQICK